MKKILLISLLFTSIILGGCKEDFLDKDTPISIEEPGIYGALSRIDATALGLYASLKGDGAGAALLGGKGLVVFDNRGEDFINLSNNGVTLDETYRMSTGDGSTENIVFWRLAYRAINNVNVFLESLEASKDVAGDDYNTYVAEAKFVRAMAYYYLSMIYSKPYALDPNAKAVPLRLKAEKSNQNNNLKRSTITEVFNQILDDVKDETINSLPAVSNNYDAVTRATKGAALMLRMRVKMAMKNWDGAIADGTAISGYSLTSSVAAPFSNPYYTTENIFSLPMGTTNTPNTQYSLIEYYYSSPTIMVLNMRSPGILSNPNYSQTTDGRVSNFTEVDGANTYLAKYTTVGKLDWAPIIRYAETLLNLSECYVEKGGASEANARELLKQVRRRSISETNDLLKDADIDALTGSALKTAIYNERRLEFLGEGMRGVDIIRRGDAFPAKGSGASAVSEVKPADSNYIWAIPSSEKSINKDLDK